MLRYILNARFFLRVYTYIYIYIILHRLELLNSEIAVFITNSPTVHQNKGIPKISNISLAVSLTGYVLLNLVN